VTEKALILLVEDDLDLADMLNAYFRVQGYDVHTAAWGEEAVRMSQDAPPDLVMLDIRLPDIDGYEVCRRLRSNRRTQHLPIIFLTEKRDRVDKLSGLELGVVDYITKPFDIQELKLRVRNVLRRAQQASLSNSVTNLPEGALVDEKLAGLLLGETPWSVLVMAIAGLESFRERYGFVAADDVLRAVSLMMNNAVREVGHEGDFVGHLSPNEFVIVTDDDHLASLHDRIELRLNQSMEYFYPLNDRDKAREAMQQNHLTLAMGQVGHKQGPFGDLDALKKALQTARKPAG